MPVIDRYTLKDILHFIRRYIIETKVVIRYSQGSEITRRLGVLPHTISFKPEYRDGAVLLYIKVSFRFGEEEFETSGYFDVKSNSFLEGSFQEIKTPDKTISFELPAPQDIPSGLTNINNNYQRFLAVLTNLNEELLNNRLPEDDRQLLDLIKRIANKVGIDINQTLTLLSSIVNGKLREEEQQDLQTKFPELIEALKRSKLFLAPPSKRIREIIDESYKTLDSILRHLEGKEYYGIIQRVPIEELISKRIPREKEDIVPIELRDHVKNLLTAHAILLAIPEKLREYVKDKQKDQTILNSLYAFLGKEYVDRLYNKVIEILDNVQIDNLNDFVSREPLQHLLSGVSFSNIFSNNAVDLFNFLLGTYKKGAFKNLVETISELSHKRVVKDLILLYNYLSGFVNSLLLRSVKLKLGSTFSLLPDYMFESGGKGAEQVAIPYDAPINVGEIFSLLVGVLNTIFLQVKDLVIIGPNSYDRVSSVWAVGGRPEEELMKSYQPGKAHSRGHSTITLPYIRMSFGLGGLKGEVVRNYPYTQAIVTYYRDSEPSNGYYATSFEMIQDTLKDYNLDESEAYIGIIATSEEIRKVSSAIELMGLLLSLGSRVQAIVLIPSEDLSFRSELKDTETKPTSSYSENAANALAAAYLRLLAEVKTMGQTDTVYNQNDVNNKLQKAINSISPKLKVNHVWNVGQFALKSLIVNILQELLRDGYSIPSVSTGTVSVEVLPEEGENIVIRISIGSQGSPINLDIRLLLEEILALNKSNLTNVLKERIKNTIEVKVEEVSKYKNLLEKFIKQVIPKARHYLESSYKSFGINSEIDFLKSENKIGEPLQYTISNSSIVISGKARVGQNEFDFSASIPVTPDLIEKAKEFESNKSDKQGEILKDAAKIFAKELANVIQHRLPKSQEEKSQTEINIDKILEKEYYSYIEKQLEYYLGGIHERPLTPEEFRTIVKDVMREAKNIYEDLPESEKSKLNKEGIKGLIDRAISKVVSGIIPVIEMIKHKLIEDVIPPRVFRHFGPYD